MCLRLLRLSEHPLCLIARCVGLLADSMMRSACALLRCLGLSSDGGLSFLAANTNLLRCRLASLACSFFYVLRTMGHSLVTVRCDDS
ncbi:hypothetical protein PENTCL1PPCAC_9853, partial [Pristionchus entomophagus]